MGNFIKNLSLRKRVFIAIIIISLSVMLILIFVINLLFNKNNELLFSEVASNLKINADLIDNEIESMETVTFNITSNKQFQNYLIYLKDTMHSDENDYERYQINNSVNEILGGHLYDKKYIEQIIVVDYKGLQHLARNDEAGKFDFEEIKVLQDIAPEDGSLLIYDKYTDYLYAVRSIRRIKSLQLDRLGILFVKINIEKLMEEMKRLNNIYVLNLENEFIYGGKSDGLDWIKQLDFDMDSGGNISKKLNEKYFVAYEKSKTLDWVYLHYVDFYETHKNLSFTINIIIIVIFFSSILVFILSSIISKAITKPLTLLIKRLKKNDYSSLSVIIAEEQKQLRNDEVGELYRDIYGMIETINELIEEKYSMQLSVEMNKIKALQAQINPHFLYNTLDSINWLAKQSEEYVLSDITESLSDYLRIIMNIDDQMISLEQEMILVGSYIKILKHRFKDKLRMDIDIKDIYMNATIPKMTIQPIVENSIKHGMKKLDRPLCISISAKKEKDDLIVEVSDNGCGFDKNAVDLKDSNKREGIGINNINQRLNRIFGEKYGLEIKSREGEGTVVLIRLPFEENGQ